MGYEAVPNLGYQERQTRKCIIKQTWQKGHVAKKKYCFLRRFMSCEFDDVGKLSLNYEVG